MTDQILKLIGAIITYGGGGAVIAFLIFRYLGKSWIENKFSERLEEFKHQQALEIQRFRIAIDSALSGALKLQEREFQTLPGAWAKLENAYTQVSAFTSPLQQYPDLDRMTSEEVDEVLDSSELRTSAKNSIRESDEKYKKYIEEIFWVRLWNVKKACSEFDVYIAEHGIFFPPNLKQKFEDISEELRSAVTSVEVGNEAKDFKLRREGWAKVEKKITPMFKDIGNEIHSRLQSHASMEG